jgi:hypothetical protein
MRHDSAVPVSYIYLDGPGIESLYAQTVERTETERSNSVERTVGGRGGAAIRLKSLLLKALGGPEVEVTGEVSGSRKRTEQFKHTYVVEQKLADLVTELRRIGVPALFTDLGEASRHADSAGKSVYVDVRERFNAPQFYVGDGVGTVNNDGYLILEKGDSVDYEYRDVYFKRPSRIVTVSASILKMPMSSRGMARAGHDSILFRGGRDVPLGLFGAMTATPSCFQIKPYAIWR